MWGDGNPPIICFWLESLSFCELGAHAKFRNPTITPNGRKVTQAEEERKKEKKRH